MSNGGSSEKAELIVVGLGGQGVQTAGELLARSALSIYEHVSHRPSYGVESRGGASECAVILSNDEILFPALRQAKAVLVLDGSQLTAFEGKVRPGGLMFVEQNRLVDTPHRDDIDIFVIPGAEVAQQLGDIRAANQVFLGAYLETTKLFPLDVFERELDNKLKNETVRRINREALRQGASRVREGLLRIKAV
jgi:2-oxoglutarate ferredoxin oxidoreductase subunit gamma